MRLEIRVDPSARASWHDYAARGLGAIPDVVVSVRSRSGTDTEFRDADLILDLTSHPAPGSWAVLYDGAPGQDAAEAALRAARFPLVSVVDAAGAVRATGRPGSEQPGVRRAALADVGFGTARLIIGAVAGTTSPRRRMTRRSPPTLTEAAPPEPSAESLGQPLERHIGRCIDLRTGGLVGVHSTGRTC